MDIEQLLARAIERMVVVYPASREVLGGDIQVIADLANAAAAQRQAKALEEIAASLDELKSAYVQVHF